MEFKKLELVPNLDACDFPDDVEVELAHHDISIHYSSGEIYIDWDEYYPITEKWLLETFGDIVKSYNLFTIIPTQRE